MGRPLVFLYPVFFALLPIVHMAAENPGEYNLDDLLWLCLGALAIVLGVRVVLSLLLRRWRSAEWVALLAAVLAAWFWGYQSVFKHAAKLLGSTNGHLAMVVVGGALSALLLVWMARRPALLESATRPLSLMAVFLLGWSCLRVTMAQLHDARSIRNNPLVRELARPIPPPAPVPGLVKRDVYLIVLDEYGNHEVLSEFFGFDNHEFLDSLRVLGFTVPRSVRSNYTWTTLSIPSMVNFAPISQLDSSSGPAVPHYLVANNRAAAFFKSQGYRFVFFPSLWWTSTHRNPHADETFNPWHGVNLAHSLSRSDIRRTLRMKSLFEFTDVGSFANDDDYIRRAFEGLTEVPGSGRPTFTFAHFVAPHGPYVFDADCRTTENIPTGKAPVKERSKAYVGMIRCIDRMVLSTVMEILRKSAVPPIILLQADHGPKSLDFDGEKSPDDVSIAQARERFGAFGAYYLPAGGDSLFRDSVTVVNVLPKVLNYYFHTSLPLSPDAHYMSVTAMGRRRIMDDRALASGQSPASSQNTP